MTSKDKKEKELEDETTPDVKTAIVMYLFLTVMPFLTIAKTTSDKWDYFQLSDNWIPKLNIYVALIYICWQLGQCIIYMIPFGGDLRQGFQLRGGHRLEYRLNGFFAFLVNIIFFVAAILDRRKVCLIADYVMEIFTASFIIQIAISVVLYFHETPERSFDINPAANKGNKIMDFLLGKSLNPRINILDLKFVIFRNAIIACGLYNFAILAKSYELNENGPRYTLLVAVGMQTMYFADTFWFEANHLVLREIRVEGCGAIFMAMSVGIPMTYSIVIRYLATEYVEMPWYCLLAIITLFLIGYWIYRGSNNEKLQYRLNPSDAKFRDYDIISTATGSKLLVSGWWGMCRHPNYFGDIILNFAMCLPAGFSHFWPYFYPTLLILILIDRARIDGAFCKQKYGEDWDTYCHRVPYKIVPKVY